MRVEDLVLDMEQLDVAYSISNENTALEKVGGDDPEEIGILDDGLLQEAPNLEDGS